MLQTVATPEAAAAGLRALAEGTRASMEVAVRALEADRRSEATHALDAAMRAAEVGARATAAGAGPFHRIGEVTGVRFGPDGRPELVVAVGGNRDVFGVIDLGGREAAFAADRLVFGPRRTLGAASFPTVCQARGRRPRAEGPPAPRARHAGRSMAPAFLVLTLGATGARLRRLLARRRRAARTERKLRAVLDVLPVGVFIADANGRITDVNPRVREIWGPGAPTPERPDQYAVFRAWWPDTGRPLAAHEWGLARAIDRGEVSGPEELRIETFDGRRRTILNYALPIRDEDGRIVGGVAVNVDITDRKAHEEADRFLADAARILASSLDYEETLGRVARLAVDRLADWCVVYIREGGEVRRLDIAARDPEKERRVRALERRYPPAGAHPAVTVIDRGEPLLLPEVPDALLREVARDETHLDLLRSIGVRSIMFVPLTVRGRTLGAVALGAVESGRTYGVADLELAKRLARHAALAIENARLFREAERRAREEEALRRATAEVSEAWTTVEAIYRIAEAALVATDADSAFVERLADGGRALEVVAAAGRDAPPTGAGLPYAGSLAERVIRSRTAELVPSIAEAAAPLPDGLRERCGDCAAIFVPLIDGGQPFGALSILRSARRAPFRPDEIERAQTFADLAALALRKVRLFESAERRRRELERASESRARLVRGFSHDVKNPLGAADLQLQVLESGARGELTPEQREGVAKARRSIRGAVALIDDLVGLAREEAGRIEVQYQPVDVRWTAREVAEAHRPEAEGKGLSLVVEAPAETPLLHTDYSRVRQILENLVTNAIKYTDEGRVAIRVHEHVDAGPSRPGRWIAIEVSDTGPGIPKEQHGLVFEEFTRLAPEGKAGYGLGLAISRRIAEALAGAIELESEPGHGSTFTLWLPVEPPAHDGLPAARPGG